MQMFATSENVKPGQEKIKGLEFNVGKTYDLPSDSAAIVT
jgi:hypothetical protein